MSKTANIPSNSDLNALGALFNQRRFSELEILAHTMTARFPEHGFAWKLLGAGLFLQGKNAEALSPMRKAADLLPGDLDTVSILGALLNNVGMFSEAELFFRRALQINPDSADVQINLGDTLRELSRLSEAEICYRRTLEINPSCSDAYNNLGVTLKDMGRLDEAIECYQRGLVIEPDFAEAYNNLGIALKDLGRVDEAEASYRLALKIKPVYFAALNNLGIALNDLGRIDEAVASYRLALKIKPDYAEAFNNLGIALKGLGRVDEAEASYRLALKIKPDYAEAFNNLGIALQDSGRLDEAEISYRKALTIKADYPELYNNLALLLYVQGRYNMALSTIMLSLGIKETIEAKRIFVSSVNHIPLPLLNSEVRNTIVRALTEPWGRPNYLARICTELVMSTPDIGEYVARAVNAWPQQLSAQDLCGVNGLQRLADEPLLSGLLNSAPVCNIKVERFLTMVRCNMLEAAIAEPVSNKGIDSVLSLYCSVARQCFINEYLFSYTDEEYNKAAKLKELFVEALEANISVSPMQLVAVASYFPLGSIPLAARLLDTDWLEGIKMLLVQQVSEPAEERQLCASIPRLTDIDDEISLLVQNQYEENPYPRWIRTEPYKKVRSFVEFLRQKFPLSSHINCTNTFAGNIDMLIAGCGTGQHSIGTAQQFQGAQILAVDLSISSLCYAKRKSRELGLISIEYAQADLLNLGSLGRSFDVIESCGVLHHLADPFNGWQILLSLLRPGGFMRLGFYSKLARRNIDNAREFIAKRGYGATAKEIRRCRQDLADHFNASETGNTLKTIDFFSISMCRDLLFHVQEHRMTLPRINTFLQENNLVFIGFEIDPEILYTYTQCFSDDRAAINLEQWHFFEEENPDTFSGMYQFWIQKA